MGLEKELVWSKHLISLHLQDTDWTLLRWQRVLLLTAKIYPSYQLSSLIWCDDVDLFSADVCLLCDQWEQKVVCGSYALDVADARDDISWWEFVSLTGSRSIQRTSGFLSAQILLHRFCTESHRNLCRKNLWETLSLCFQIHSPFVIFGRWNQGGLCESSWCSA